MAGISMDVFNQDAFSAQNMTAAIDKEGYVPTLLGGTPGLFVPPPLGQPRSKAIFIEERDNEPAIIHTSPRGAEPSPGRTDEKTRKVRPFMIPRLARSRRIQASEIAGIRAYGSVTEMQSLEMMVQRQQYLLQRDFSLTWENMRLGAVQGLVKDAAGETIYNYATEFDQTIPAEVDFDLDAASPVAGILRTRCTTAIRSMTRGLKGLGGNAVTFMAICGDDFWDLLIAHVEVRQTYLNYAAAASLRDKTAWESFYFGGITWTNYRGTDDGSTVSVGTTKAKMFPVGAGIFQEIYAPADERFEFDGSPGQQSYSWIVTDQQRNMWADVEMYSYPLFMCTMPQALYQAKMT